MVYQLLEQNIIARIFKNTRSFVHRKTAQWDFGEWDIKYLYPSTLVQYLSYHPRPWLRLGHV